MPSIQTLLSEKGKPMVVHQGSIYTREKSTTSKTFFRCKNRDCKSLLTSRAVIIKTADHYSI